MTALLSSSQPSAQSRVPTTKRAAIGGEQESGFEQAFSSLAWAYLKDKAPRLIDYTVGFQLVDQNDDNTKACGIFGFQVGDQWLYAPVFFLNGDLKGHELLYVKNKDMFVPLKENWINYLMSRKPHMLGEGSSQDTFALGGLSPNIERLSWPPEQSKYGGDSQFHRRAAFHRVVKQGFSRGPTLVDEWAKPVMPMMASAKLSEARFLYKSANVVAGRQLKMDAIVESPTKAALASCPIDLHGFLSSNVNIARGALKIAQRYPGIKLAFDRFYGEDFFQKLAVDMAKQAKSSRGNIMAPAATRRQNVSQIRKNADMSLLPPEPEKRAAGPAVTITVKEDVGKTQNLGVEMDEDDKTEVLNHGYLVKDERKGDEVSKVYNTQVPQSLTNPDTTGLYKVLERPAEFSQMLVISNPISNTGRQDCLTVVRMADSGSKGWLNAHRSVIWHDQSEPEGRSEFEKWFDDLGAGDLKKDGIYIGIDKDGSGTVPFRVRETYGGGRYKVDFKTYIERGRDRGFPSTTRGRFDGSPTYGGDYISEYGAKLLVDPEGRDGTAMRATSNGELRLPGRVKFVQLKPPPKPKKDKDNLLGCAPCSAEVGGESDDKPIEPGRLEDIQLMFTEKTSALRVYRDGEDVWLKTSGAEPRRFGRRDALFSLILNHGVREKSAAAMLDAVDKNKDKSQVFRVKYAQGYPHEFTGPGVGAPAFPAPLTGTEGIGYAQVPSIYPQEQFIGVPGLQSDLTDPKIYDPFLMPDQNSMGAAQQAGMSGQKEVFDTSMLSGMLRNVRDDNLVDKHLGDLMSALDALGRLILQFHWHNDQFVDRYGKEDVPELEDALKSSFENLGDLVLFIRQRETGGDAFDMSSPDIGDTAEST